MQRRQFAAAAVALPLGFTLSTPTLAQESSPVDSTEYRKLQSAVGTEVPAGKVEVLEFFGYWCPHCANFEPAFDAWLRKAPAKAVVRRVPVAFRADMAPLLRLYYTLEKLGVLPTLHAKVFDALHKQRINLLKEDVMLAWASMQPELAKRPLLVTYNSEAVRNQVKQADQLASAYGIEGVPSFGVAGKYYLDGMITGSMERALVVVNHLIRTA